MIDDRTIEIYYSILGMNLFGCKFCEKVGEDVICDRKNFDSLLWALVTVFQVDFIIILNKNLNNSTIIITKKKYKILKFNPEFVVMFCL